MKNLFQQLSIEVKSSKEQSLCVFISWMEGIEEFCPKAFQPLKYL